MSKGSAFEQLEEVCRPALGRLQPMPPSPYLDHAIEATGAAEITDETVFLSPPEDRVVSSVLGVVRPGQVYRGPADHRSFNLRLDPTVHAGLRSLTVKGGDLPHVAYINEMDQWEIWQRTANGQIPGGGLLSYLTTERDAAFALHERTLELTGALARTALPLRLSNLETVVVGEGEHLSIQEYLDSTAYSLYNRPDHKAELAALSGVSRRHALPIGSFLATYYDVQAAEYIYATTDMNLRVETAWNTLQFRQADATGEFMRAHSTFPTLADSLPRQERKDKVFRAVYAYLGEAYDFDAADVLPPQMIVDENYDWALQTIPEKISVSGLGQRIVDTFIDRITAVVMAAHSQEATFSCIPNISGSLVPRNVTLGGTVLDLDTYGSFRDSTVDVQEDLYSATASAVTMSRLVGQQPRGVGRKVWTQYRQHLKQCSGQLSTKLVKHLLTVPPAP